MELFRKSNGPETRWSSPENLTAGRAAGGMENQGAKGHWAEVLPAGGQATLLNVQGSGTVRRIFLSTRHFSPLALRALTIEMYWDNAPTPAVRAPLGDFFCNGLGQPVAFENELFINSEGRSLSCFVPMPFRSAARIIIRNESDKDTMVYFDVNLTLGDKHDADVLYFHTYWNRVRRGKLGEDFVVLPTVRGAGRYVGANFSVISNPAWRKTWWGEGEAKIYLDGDDKFPTLTGTGTEDYIGAAWGMGRFSSRYGGCILTDIERGHFAFYRLHIPDPVFFFKDCRVTIQDMGGAPKFELIGFKAAGVEMKLTSVVQNETTYKVLEMTNADGSAPALEDEWILPKAWCNVYRLDDFAAAAYFYLDSPENHLPPLPPLSERLAGVPVSQKPSGPAAG